LIYGENTVVISYRSTRSRAPVELKVRPLLAFRDYNSLQKRNDATNMSVERGNAVLSVQPFAKLPRLYFYTKADVETKADWYNRFNYPVEQERGLDFEEDLFTPFELTFKIASGQVVHIVVSTEKKASVDAEALFAAERERRKQYEREKGET